MSKKKLNMETIKEKWECPAVTIQRFTPQEFVAVCESITNIVLRCDDESQYGVLIPGRENEPAGTCGGGHSTTIRYNGSDLNTAEEIYNYIKTLDGYYEAYIGFPNPSSYGIAWVKSTEHNPYNGNEYYIYHYASKDSVHMYTDKTAS